VLRREEEEEGMDVEQEEVDQVREERKALVASGAVLLASKSSTRFGDGDAQIALWKHQLPDYLSTGHVKYAISSIANTVASSGAMGRRVAIDSRHNIFINTQGECHTNLHSDLHVEHCNKAFKEGLKNVAGNSGDNLVRRQALALNLQKSLEPKLMPTYSETGLPLNEKSYRGHGTADWTEYVGMVFR